MKTGMRFKNAGMDCEVLKFDEGKIDNIALLYCHSDGLYITVSNLQLFLGKYIWVLGHYYSDKQSAEDDYKKRKKDL